VSLSEEHLKELGIKMGLRITMKQWISQRGHDQHQPSSSTIQPLLESEPRSAQTGSPTQSSSSTTTSAPLLVIILTLLVEILTALKTHF